MGITAEVHLSKPLSKSGARESRETALSVLKKYPGGMKGSGGGGLLRLVQTHHPQVPSRTRLAPHRRARAALVAATTAL